MAQLGIRHEKALAEMTKSHNEAIKVLKKEHEKMNGIKNERIKTLNAQINLLKAKNSELLVSLKNILVKASTITIPLIYF